MSIMALTIQQIQANITDKDDLREIVNQLADYLEANPGGGSPGGGGVQSVQVTLTDTQIKALPTTPIEILPAQGTGKVAQLLYARIEWNDSAGEYTNDDPDCIAMLTYGDGASPASSLLNLGSDGNNRMYFLQGNSFDSVISGWAGSAQNSGISAATIDNVAIKLYCENAVAGDFTGGNAVNTLKVTVYYVVVDL